MKREIAYFGAGCFWGVQHTFSLMLGVLKSESGYMGGYTENPTYHDVCTDTTGHAEVVRVEFDTERVSYEELLDVFWHCHDPTQGQRQGPDIGSQYRSIILYTSPEQKKAAEVSQKEYQNELRRAGRGTIMTEIVPAGIFSVAEEYHQEYVMKHGGDVCHYNVPQLKKKDKK